MIGFGLSLVTFGVLCVLTSAIVHQNKEKKEKKQEELRKIWTGSKQ